MSGRRRPNQKRFIQSTVDRQREELFYLNEDVAGQRTRANTEAARALFYKTQAEAGAKVIERYQRVISALRRYLNANGGVPFEDVITALRANDKPAEETC